MGVLGKTHPGQTLEALWVALETAGRFDPTVRISRRKMPKMLRHYVAPAHYTRETLFGRMLAGEPSVLTGFPKPLRGTLRDLPPAAAGQAVLEWLAKRRDHGRHRIFSGPTGRRRELTLREIASKWRADRTRFGVTDLHIRETAMEEIIAPEILSQFNLLPHGSPAAREQEMFSFVISTRGYVTDSHSDAPDSTNYCFVGRKLWLAWDTYEGARLGLQDVDRVPVFGRARFDMESWLSLRSARWFLVNPGQTLFLPAHMTHKVITLEPYIGVGGFFLALPNCLRLLSHWIVRGPLWSKRDLAGIRDHLLADISDSVRNAVVRLKKAPLRERKRWGYDYLERSAEFFIESCPADHLRMLWTDPRFRSVADIISTAWPLPSTQAARLI